MAYSDRRSDSRRSDTPDTPDRSDRQPSAKCQSPLHSLAAPAFMRFEVAARRCPSIPHSADPTRGSCLVYVSLSLPAAELDLAQTGLPVDCPAELPACLPCLARQLCRAPRTLHPPPHDASTPVWMRRPPASGFGAHYCTPMWLVCHWQDLGNMQRSCTLCWLDALVRSSKDPGGSKLPGPTSCCTGCRRIFFFLVSRHRSGNGWRRVVEAQARLHCDSQPQSLGGLLRS